MSVLRTTEVDSKSVVEKHDASSRGSSTRREFLKGLAGGLGAAAAALFAGAPLLGRKTEPKPAPRPSGPVDNVFEPISEVRKDATSKNPPQERGDQ